MDTELKGNGCPVYKKCGGCQLQNLTYPEQLSFKQGREIALLGRYGHVSRIIGMDDPYRYRCKVQAAFGHGRGGLISGVYQSGSGRIVPVDACMTEDAVCDAVIVTVRKLMTDFRIRSWDGSRGTVRHVLVRRGKFTGQLMVVIVTAVRQLPSKGAFLAALLERHPEITTVVQNVCTNPLPLTLGRENNILFGSGYIEDTLQGCTFRISPNSFYQVNPVMAQTLCGKMLEFLDLTGGEEVLDAYCGTGTMGIIASRSAGHVTGVELSGDAVRDAVWNARRSGAENTEFFKGDAGAFMQGMAERGKKLDALIMDPPRAGSSALFIRSAVLAAPKRIVYVSCNPETLARDLALFTRASYRVRRIQPVDMFPHTNHIETVCLLAL